MKNIHKLLMILGILFLISKTATAQMVQYSADGSKSCLECPGVEDFLVPLYFIPGEWNNWRNYIPTGNSEALDRWLRFQELEMAKVMTGYNNLQYSDITDFNAIQRHYFTDLYFGYVKYDYLPLIRTELDNVDNFDATVLNNATTNHAVMNDRLYNQTGDYSRYGDLKYEGEYIRDIEAYYSSRMVEREKRTRDAQRDAKNQKLKNDAYWNFINQNTEILSEYLANRMIDHYNGLAHEDAAIWMNTVIAANIGWATNQELMNNIWDVKDNNYLGGLMHTMFSQELDYPQNTTWPDLPFDEALFRYALNTEFSAPARSFIKGKESLKDAWKEYLRFHEYPHAQLDFGNDLANSYVQNQSFNHENYNYQLDTGDLFSMNFQNQNNPNRAFTMVQHNTPPYNTFYGLDRLLSSFSNLDNPKEEFIGSFVRELLQDNSITVPISLTNADMFDLFEFTPREPYANLGRYAIGVDFRNNIGQTLWQNGVRFPDMLQSSFETHSALTLANYNTSVEATAYIQRLLESGRDGSLITASPFVKYPKDKAEQYTRDYPELTRFLQEVIPTIANNDKIINEIKGITDAPIETIKEALQWGKGPEIEIEQLGGEGINEIYGVYRGAHVPELRNKLFIDIDLVNDLENLENSAQFREEIGFLIAVTILHEYNHFGDAVFGDLFWEELHAENPVDENEAGTVFEITIFGVTVWRSNVGLVMRNFGNW